MFMMKTMMIMIIIAIILMHIYMANYLIVGMNRDFLDFVI